MKLLDHAALQDRVNYIDPLKNIYTPYTHRDGSSPAIVSLLFDVIAHRDRLALKRKALGRRRRRFARRNRNRRGQP